MTVREVPPADKASLRQHMSALRRGVAPEVRAARSRAACEKLCAQPAFERARTLCAYMPLPLELDVRYAIEVALAAGKRVALPRVRPGTSEMSLHLYGPDDVLVQGGFRVHEPDEGAALADEAAIELVIVPGLAFDVAGYRLGFGKGFYDRLLPRLPAAERLGIGFAFQWLPEVPHQEHDIPVHGFVSEAGSVRC